MTSDPQPYVTRDLWRTRLGTLLAVGDAIVISLSSLAAYAAREALGETGVVRELAAEVPAALGVIPLWLLLLYWAGAYRPEYLNAGGDAFRRFSAGTAGGVLALGFLSFLLNLQLSRLYVAFLFVFSFLLGGGLRMLLRRYLARRHARGELTQTVLLVGDDAEARALASALAGAAHAGYRVRGFLSPDLPRGADVDGYPVLGRPEQVVELAAEHRAGLVIVSPSGLSSGTLRAVTVALEGTPVDLAVAPSLFEVVSRRVIVESVANVPILHVAQIRLEGWKAWLKRTLDVLVALLLGTFLVPIWLAAAVAVRLDDGGPALFRQRRVGKDGEPFEVLKFRTMVPDAEARLVDVEHLNEVGHGFFKVRDDPRVTRVGRFLRKWSIDEVPQLWNVLRGEMSMVGPRPPLPEEVKQYEPWQLRRLRVRPGITGVWQVSGRSHVPFDEAVRMDLFYIENWSLGYDLFLLGKTVLAVLGRRGAY